MHFGMKLLLINLLPRLYARLKKTHIRKSGWIKTVTELVLSIAILFYGTGTDANSLFIL